MELKLTSLQFTFFLIFSLIFLAQAKLYLAPSDYKAFRIIQRDLGIDDHHPSFTKTPCNSSVVSCERRVANYSSVLKITRILYDSEQLEGFMSPAVGQLTELRELTLSTNHLGDQIPEKVTECRKLEVLNLKNNQFSGVVPSELSKLVRLRVLDLSMNKLSGDLSFLKYFPNLETLSIANNLFTGKVPASLKSIRNLQFFDIPGNDYIPAQAPSPSPPKHKHHNKRKKLAAWLLGFLAGGVVGGIFVMGFSVLVKMGLTYLSRRGKHSGPSIFSPLIKKAEDLAFLAKEDGLANFQVIGRGGCGEVYKAELPGSNGKIIAVKKINLPANEQATDLNDQQPTKMLSKKVRQIRAEIQTIGRIQHRNLLPLLAHVARPECHYLVYEYMNNGSLQDIMTQVAEKKRKLDWLWRYNIALGVAAGLEYLHMITKPRIIHRDLKPANILLDDEMEPRIADFGLAKKMAVEDSHMSTSNVAGTVGYIAPDYFQTMRLTEKIDIYSFGVILGGLIMGKLPGDEFFQHTKEMNLVQWMRNVMSSDHPERALDPELIGNGSEQQMLQVLKIACFCTVDNPRQRPNSKEVRYMLLRIGSISDVFLHLYPDY